MSTEDINLYKVGDCDWVAARSVEEAKAGFAQHWVEAIGGDLEDIAEEEAVLVDPARLPWLTYDDYSGNLSDGEPKEYTFEQALALMLASGHVPPFHFASTEY